MSMFQKSKNSKNTKAKEKSLGIADDAISAWTHQDPEFSVTVMCGSGVLPRSLLAMTSGLFMNCCDVLRLQLLSWPLGAVVGF